MHSNFCCGNYGIGGNYWTHHDSHKSNRVATILTVFEAPKAGMFLYFKCIIIDKHIVNYYVHIHAKNM